MHDAQMVGRLQRRLPDDRPLENGLRRVLRVGIQAKDLAEVRPARLPQLEPVGLRPAVRLLVRMDVPLAEPLQPHAAHEPAPRERLPALVEHLVVHVDRRLALR